MAKFSRIFFISTFFLFVFVASKAQVNSVTFGKNRIQYKKFKWEFYQTSNFNVYFNKGGKELAKFVAQVAENELPSIEAAAEYSLQRRANIILYNEFADMKQSNIGLETDALAATGAVTRLVNNKMVLYYDANHYNLKRQIRQGIADVITKNVLFGDDLGEVASNQALLDLPVWLTDGYVAYLGENWSAALDDDLKAEILSGEYKKFSKLAFRKPLLAGHSFWYYIEEKYKKENVTYFLYLARVYKNLDKACKQITKLSFKKVQADFMEYNEEKYDNDISRRRYFSKGSVVESFDINKRQNFYRFNVNPVKKNNDYVVTKFSKGIVRVILNEDGDDKTILKYGHRAYEAEVNPSYPIMAWDPRGTRISVIYSTEGKLKLFVYDVVTRIKQYKIDLTNDFDQVQDVKYMLNSRTLLLSAIKNGHADIYSYDIEKEKVTQITNDVYDDLDPTFVSFPGKTGIIFSSNRPSPEAKSGDTMLPSDHRFNVFLANNFGDKPELNQITQLTKLKYGNARFPTPYNNTHFTFISDENGIANRYAGFFVSKAEGLDTLVIIGEDILRNPSAKYVDSTLRANKKTDVDSIAIVAVSSDSTYVFPLSNYPSSLAESRIAGEMNQVSEVSKDYGEKTLFKLKIDENTLRRRNITATPTEYARKLMRESKLTTVKAVPLKPGEVRAVVDTVKKQDDFFQSEFANEKPDTTKIKNGTEIRTPGSADPTANDGVLAKAKLFKYKPIKFSIDYGSGGLQNSVLVNRYERYNGGVGPIKLNNSSPLSGLVRMGTSDLLEDIKINGGYKLGTNLKDNEWLLNYQNLKRRLDWGLTYYRNVQGYQYANTPFTGREFTNLYQINISYPFDETKSIRYTHGVRSDNAYDNANSNDINTLYDTSYQTCYSMSHIEFVYDNSIKVAQNIMYGARAKIYGDFNRQINKDPSSAAGSNSFNIGFDARYYHPIYRNFIWAGRAAGDFSFGDQKLIYFLGGVDGWLMFGPNKKANGKDRYFYENNPPDQNEVYAFQSLAVNMRGFKQNIASGSNYFVLNSEFRLPVFTTLFDKTINNSFIRNFMLTQFIDIGTAWNGGFDQIKRPVLNYNTPIGVGIPGPVTVKLKAGGIGPFAGGYGFGARSSLIGYYVKFDASWQMNGFFRGKPQMYLSLGLDF